MAHPPGSLCWFELATTDQPAAKQFYQSLFGWETVDSPMGPDDVYTMLRLGGQDVGALYTMRPEQRAQGMPPNWLVYVAVADADATAAQARALGGRVHAEPFDVMEHGRMAVLADPTGATFAIWQARQHAGTGVTGRVDRAICWADLSTPDQEKAAAFYTALFGWKMVADKDMTPASPGDYFHIASGQDLIGGISPSAAHPSGTPAYWLVYVAVPNCRETETQAANLGAQVHASTFPIGENGFVAVLADPQGAVFGIHQQQ